MSVVMKNQNRLNLFGIAKYIVCFRAVIASSANREVTFVPVLNRITQALSKEFRNTMEMDGNILKYQSIQWHMNAAAPTSLWSKEGKKNCDVRCISDCFNAVMVTPANGNICKNQLVWGEDGFLYLYCQTQSKTITCTTRWRKYLQLH